MTDYFEPLRYVVPPEEDGWLLNTILRRRMALSRRLVTRLKGTERGITVNGERRWTNTRVSAGDIVEIRMEREESDDILPQPIPFDMIYEDEHLLIVNKAAGLVVHPTRGHYTNTLANGVVHYWRERGENCRFCPVHRLDRETSGVLAIAKNAFVHRHISEQMKANRTLKQYVAVVHGVLPMERGTIRAAIGRSPENPNVRIVLEEGPPAVTHFEVVERYRFATQIRVRLETGKTHQIRVHLKSLGHPLIGDKMYGLNANSGADPAEPSLIDRHALHAERLGFEHPVAGRWMEFAAPLPEDMERLLRKLSEA
jgi:23S rRNA pseudouridine1911/1915/1917 synthase